MILIIKQVKDFVNSKIIKLISVDYKELKVVPTKILILDV